MRAFLRALDQQGDLLEIDRPVSLDEVGPILRQVYDRQGPAVVFKNTGHAAPLVAGLYATRRHALLAFETQEGNALADLVARLDRRIPPRLVSAGPCQEVRLTGEAIDLTAWPIPQYNRQDGGPYITAGLVVSRDPETGVHDLGHYRFQVLGRDRMAFLAQPFHRFGKHLIKAKRLRVPMKAALVLGTDPILAYTGPMQVPDDTDDYHLAGGLRGEAVAVVPALTGDYWVPAAAEVVIEFEVQDELAQEGPLGEYTGYYTPASPKPVARVTAITHRRQPYFQGLLTGKPVTENHILKQLPFEATLFRELRRRFPTVTDIAVPPAGGVSFHVVVAMAPRYAGEARQVGLDLLAHNSRPKWVTVVDPDIDCHNPDDVAWAVAFRTRPERDVIIVPGLPAGPLDPAVEDTVDLAARAEGAVVIDATRPFGQPFPATAGVAERAVAVPELEAWLGRGHTRVQAATLFAER
jgi:2,5-furandicarboxylate decarboxylase 1